jgi:hypothetical protein
MHKSMLALTAAVILLAGSVAWKAEAAPGSNTSLPSVAHDFSPVEKVACGGPGFCKWDVHLFVVPRLAGVLPAGAIAGADGGGKAK